MVASTTEISQWKNLSVLLHYFLQIKKQKMKYFHLRITWFLMLQLSPLFIRKSHNHRFNNFKFNSTNFYFFSYHPTQPKYTILIFYTAPFIYCVKSQTFEPIHSLLPISEKTLRITVHRILPGTKSKKKNRYNKLHSRVRTAFLRNYAPRGVHRIHTRTYLQSELNNDDSHLAKEKKKP